MIVRLLLLGASAAFIGTVLLLPQDVNAGFVLSVSLGKGSVNCGLSLDGGGPQKDIDGAATCTLTIRQASRQCVNKGGNAEPAKSDNFAEYELPIFSDYIGGLQSKTKNGPTAETINFSDAELLAIILAGDPNFSLDPAVVCQNKTWKVKWAITRLDMTGTVSTVPVQCKVDVNGDGICEDSNGDRKITAADAISSIPFYLPGSTVFAGCDPLVSGLRYAYPDASGNPDLAKQVTGKLDECLLFKDWKNIPGDSRFTGQNNGGCVVGVTGETAYSCLCADHGGQTGNYKDPGLYQQTAGIFTSADPECTGGVQLMK